jgi:tetratricopeptide (TPR) repeat protein
VDAGQGVQAAERLREQGQAAMKRGEPDVAIRCYGESLTADPSRVENHLDLAAAYLEKKEANTACAHLAKYAAAHPEELASRARYADLLTRLHRTREARLEWEQVIALAQEQGGTAAKRLIDCHRRLAELAEASEDTYTEHLNRGIGLYLLARKRSSLPEPDGVLPAEGLFFKAAAELTLAQLERPDEARPCWYLYAVWSEVGQRQPALCRLRQAEASAPFTYLTPTEQRSLQFAFQSYRAGLRRD